MATTAIGDRAFKRPYSAAKVTDKDFLVNHGFLLCAVDQLMHPRTARRA